MSKRIIAILAVFLMVASPLAVVMYAEAGEATQNEDVLTLDTINGKSDYWVRADVTGGNAVLSITGNSNGGELNLTGTSITSVKISDGFTVPKGKIINCLPSTATTDENEPTLALTVDKDFTVKGGITGKVTMTNNVKITFNGAVVGADDNRCVVTFSATGGNMELIGDTNIVGLDVMRPNEVTSDEKPDYCSGIKFTDVSANNVELLYHPEPTNADHSWSIYGNFMGLTSESKIEFGDASAEKLADGFLWNSVVLSKINIIVNYETVQNIVLKDDKSALFDYSDCKLVCDNEKIFQKFKNNATGKVVAMLVNYAKAIEDEGTLVITTVDDSGVTGYYCIAAVATEGISSISQKINFVKMGETIDLSTITVTCENGYKFSGWYYVDEKGVMCKILNPSEFIVTEHMKIYAKADKIDSPAEKDYSMYWTGAIAVLVLILLVGCAAFYMRFLKKD